MSHEQMENKTVGSSDTIFSVLAGPRALDRAAGPPPSLASASGGGGEAAGTVPGGATFGRAVRLSLGAGSPCAVGVEEIGNASSWARVCKSVMHTVGVVSLKKKKIIK